MKVFDDEKEFLAKIKDTSSLVGPVGWKAYFLRFDPATGMVSMVSKVETSSSLEYEGLTLRDKGIF